MKKLILTFFVFSIVFCNGINRNKKLIAGDSYKYWLVLSDDNKSTTKVFYYFDRDGKWIVFKKSFDNSFYKYDGGDVQLIESWNLISDTVVYIGNAPCSITELNDSVFAYKNNIYGMKTMVRVPEGMVPSSYQKKYSD